MWYILWLMLGKCVWKYIFIYFLCLEWELNYDIYAFVFLEQYIYSIICFLSKQLKKYLVK